VVTGELGDDCEGVLGEGAMSAVSGDEVNWILIAAVLHWLIGFFCLMGSWYSWKFVAIGGICWVFARLPLIATAIDEHE